MKRGDTIIWRMVHPSDFLVNEICRWHLTFPHRSRDQRAKKFDPLTTDLDPIYHDSPNLLIVILDTIQHVPPQRD